MQMLGLLPRRHHEEIMFVKNAMSVQVDTVTATVAGAGALLYGFVGGDNMILLSVLACFFVLDLLSGMGRAFLSPIEEYDGRALLRGIVKKLMRIMLIFVAGGMDLVGSLLPAFGTALEQSTPMTKMVIALLIAAEVGSIVKNVRAATGDASVFEFIMRRIDVANLGGQEPPKRRHYDTRAVAEEGKLLGKELDRRNRRDD